MPMSQSCGETPPAKERIAYDQTWIPNNRSTLTPETSEQTWILKQTNLVTRGRRGNHHPRRAQINSGDEGPHPRAYWGFEASGPMHIGMGLVCGKKILEMVEAGFDYTIFLADWHSWINNKLGGVMENIHLCGEYFKQCFSAIGIAPEKVTYLWASDLAAEREYWEKVVRIAKSVNVSRIWRALPIMGRGMESKDLEAASTFYPCMQAADIFELQLDVACAGMDQRKAHVLARDVAEKLEWQKPTSVHTHLLMGLVGSAEWTQLNMMKTQSSVPRSLSKCPRAYLKAA